MLRFLLPLVIIGFSQALRAQETVTDIELQLSLEQLRTSVGRWEVVTEFLNPDGSVARAVEGAYEFSWVVPDRVVAGKSEIPELEQTSAILFYVNEKDRLIEMVSVGKEGKLWVMTGPLGGEERLTEEFETAAGGAGRLRFTRYNITPESFESRMEYTEDGGETWAQGNHQTFRRVQGTTDS